MEALEEVRRRRLSRRNFITGLAGTAGAAGVVAVTGCSHFANQMTPTPTPIPTPAINDPNILNFALNLEYLEAEYYLRATTGMGLSAADAGSSAGTVTGGAQVPFQTAAIQEYAVEIANDELSHVRFLRSALGSSAVDRPAIDLMNSFNSAVSAAGIGPSFNPFADENSFILGAFVFEDVGVTAYHGAATLLTSTANLGAAGAIMAVEAYHAGEIRTHIAQLGGNYLTYANQISALRAAAGGGSETPLTGSAIVAADSTSIAYDRTPDQVLHIVYLNATPGVVKSGGFFPNGLNGAITASAY